MKLVELVGIKSVQTMTLGELIQYFLEHSKYEYKGTGAFAYVFKHPTKDEVIKLWLNDSMYEKFVKYALARQHNPALPKFKGPIKEISTFHKRLKGFPDKIKYIRMELLKHIEDSDERMRINTIHWPSEIALAFQGHPEMMSPDKIIQQLAPTLGDMCDELGVPMKEHRGLDIHANNIMMRGKQFVITDPFADDQDMEKMYSWEELTHKNNVNDPENADKVVIGKTKSAPK